MEEQIDKRFREGLTHHRKDPPPRIWEGIAGSALFPPDTNKPQRKRKPLGWITLAGVILLPASVWLLWFFMNHQPDTTPQNTPKHDIRVTNYAPSTQISTVNKQPVTSEIQVAEKQTTKPQTTIVNDIVSNILPDQSALKPKQTVTAKADDAMVPVSIQANQDKPETASRNPENKEPEAPQETEILIAGKEPEMPPAKPDTVQNITPKKEYRDTANRQDTSAQNRANLGAAPPSRTKLPLSAKPLHFFAALLAGPVLYEDHSPYTERIRSAGEGALIGKIGYNRFFLSAGAGISSFTDRNPSRLTLERIDTVGLYPYVTSVLFQPVFDSTHTTVIGYTPVNITTKTHVAVDTARLSEDKTLNTRYTWLQVPIMAGCEIIQNPPFSLALQGGMVYLRLLDEDRKIPVYPEGTRITAIENLAWQRREQLWYFQAGVQARYDLNNQWYAGMSVNVGQPVQSIYKNTENRIKPFTFHLGGSIGIRLQ
ncbi:MAG TPA: hypothetical protein P5228_01750 [Bacteroidales bacterium]|nr:hypothetical protein [Bacteroidales bacterium]HRZ48255.1 hypothetical protein [Bacteroidales bacterium]